MPKKKRKSPKAKHQDPTVAQLEDIKRLLMLQLIVSGAKAKDLAIVLGVTKSAISALVPARLIRKGI